VRTQWESSVLRVLRSQEEDWNLYLGLTSFQNSVKYSSSVKSSGLRNVKADGKDYCKGKSQTGGETDTGREILLECHRAVLKLCCTLEATKSYHTLLF
jgi:hypothetical protein